MLSSLKNSNLQKARESLLDEAHPCRRPLQILDPKFIKIWFLKKVIIFLENDPQTAPKKSLKSQKICKNAPRDPSRMDLETHFGKSRLPDSPRESRMCENATPAMHFTLPSECLQTRFGFHFGPLSPPFSGPGAPKSRPRIKKRPSKKTFKICIEKDAPRPQK